MSEPFRLRTNGRVHFSAAKRMAISPAHARYYCEHPIEPTPAMQFGSLVDALALDVGKRAVRIFDGPTRRGEKWEAFQADCPPGALIVKRDEHDRASAVANALHADPVAAPLIRGGEHQRVIEWDMHGLPWGAGIAGVRGGFDVLGDDYLFDLKTTMTTEPRAWSRQARRMMYVEQLVAYKHGAEAIGRKIDTLYIGGIETRAPFCVTVLRLTAADIESADRRLYAWCERIKQCEAANYWPGYVQSAVDIEPASVWDQLEEIEE